MALGLSQKDVDASKVPLRSCHSPGSLGCLVSWSLPKETKPRPRETQGNLREAKKNHGLPLLHLLILALEEAVHAP